MSKIQSNQSKIIESDDNVAAWIYESTHSMWEFKNSDNIRYVLDKKRMENGSFLGEDYFERLLEEIREIRLSERRFYQKITDIYATSVDYNKDAPITKAFFAKVQNKLHFAVHGNTAAELIMKRADSNKANMGWPCRLYVCIFKRPSITGRAGIPGKCFLCCGILQ